MQNFYRINATGEVLELHHTETITSHPKDITIYVLSDGSRWCAEDFFKYLSAAQPYIQATDAPQGADDNKEHSGVSA